MEVVVQDQKVSPKRITVSDLVRRGAEIFDEVDIDGSAFLVTRYGRPVGLLTPVRPDSKRPVRRRLVDRRAASAPQEVEPAVELNEQERHLLSEIGGRAPRPWNPETIEEWRRTADPVFELEMKGLVLKDSPGYRLTAVGARLLSILR